MKIRLQLDSSHFTDAQNEMLRQHKIVVDWDLPNWPRENEIFDCDTILPSSTPETLDFIFDLIWHVTSVNYAMVGGKIMVTLWLIGE